ncbi:putative reverse transcriptase domain-containing protein [Tanacetum coccineum]
MVGAGHVAYTNRFHKLARLVPHLVTPKNKRIERYIYGLAPQIRGMVAATEPATIQKVVQKAGTLTNEAVRNGSLKRNTEKIVRREYTGTTPKCRNCNLHHLLESPCRACFSCNHLGHLAKDCRVVPRMVNLVNARNPTAACRACLNVVIPIISRQHVLGIETSNLGFSYEIEIASGQLVEIDKVIRGCKLEIEVHTFNIDLIPFGSGSFDVLVGMDWLSKHKAEIICHEKVVRIPLRNGKTLIVIGERPEEKVRHLSSAKTKEQKKEDIVVVRNFSEVFPDDLSGLPPYREIKFRIDLILGAILVKKSPYRLAPSEMKELSGQLKEI